MIGDGGQLALGQKYVSFTNTTTKTLANIPVDRARDIQTLTIRVNGRDFHVAKVYILPERPCLRGYR